MMGPLSGVRILTLENFGAGPFGSMYLADLGAEVIKIENRATGGDASRGMGPYFLGEHDSEYFQTFNLNKKSCALNLKTAQGKAAFHHLVSQSDAVMNNLRGDQPQLLGLRHEDLRAVNPKIVCAHLSAYGRDNERYNWPGYDYLMQAEAGFLHMTGEPGGPPTRVGLSMIDFMTGITGALALVASIMKARQSGVGCDVDVSLFDVALHQLSYPGIWYLNEQVSIERQPRSAHPNAAPVQLYRTADGWIFLMCMTEKFWLELVDILGDAALATDPLFLTMKDRRTHRDALTERLDDLLSAKTTAAWMDLFSSRLPAAPVCNLAGALDNPYVARIGMTRTTPHPHRPDFRTLGSPIKIDGHRPEARVCSSLGADTEALLRQTGYSEDQIAALIASERSGGGRHEA
jgi:crotonobetainyl-CoA:carnitine CoA-transferase CaiB-like acyl-CoA transferase